ncbi:MAG: DUF4258 domain-containing protein [Candidatus Moraniibacteriota bacterium]
MKIIFSDHARRRMGERDISSFQVSSAILQPDKIEVDKTTPNRFVAKKVYAINKSEKKHLLLVFYEFHPETDQIEVITVVSTSKIRKYY